MTMCTVNNNTARGGGGIYYYSSELTMTNYTAMNTHSAAIIQPFHNPCVTYLSGRHQAKSVAAEMNRQNVPLLSTFCSEACLYSH